MSKTVLTPADLDLKVKDRKPDVVPKVGDLVKIKSRKWYEKWKSSEGNVYLPGNVFTLYMASHCGCNRTISVVAHGDFMLKKEAGPILWSPEFFEEVLPVNEAVAEMTVPSIDTDVAYSSTYHYPVVTYDKVPEPWILNRGSIISGSITADEFPAISHLSGFGRTTAEEAIKAFTITDPPVIHFAKEYGPEEPAQLKTIKRKRFIKIKNL